MSLLATTIDSTIQAVPYILAILILLLLEISFVKPIALTLSVLIAKEFSSFIINVIGHIIYTISALTPFLLKSTSII
jgi:hypothetical protein